MQIGPLSTPKRLATGKRCNVTRLCEEGAEPRTVVEVLPGAGSDGVVHHIHFEKSTPGTPTDLYQYSPDAFSIGPGGGGASEFGRLCPPHTTHSVLAQRLLRREPPMSVLLRPLDCVPDQCFDPFGKAFRASHPPARASALKRT